MVPTVDRGTSVGFERSDSKRDHGRDRSGDL